MSQSLGHYLLNDALPKAHRIDGPIVTKGDLSKRLLALAREDQAAYVDVVSKLKYLGDQVSTLEGVSVGLDDIEPVYTTRDAIMKPAIEKIKRARTVAEREKIILEAQAKLLDHTKKHPGSMTPMALSGARGSIPQLLKTVASPVASVDAKGQMTPWLIGRSYSEGLTPAEYWVTGNEARINTVKSATAISEPGDMLKIVTNAFYPHVITKDDCGTHNGIAMSTGDNHALSRFLARSEGRFRRNEAITPAVLVELRKAHRTVLVRSPMTCEAHEGLCSKCQGLDENFRPHPVGTHIGARSAQALTEPMAQFALDAKHGVRTLKGTSAKVGGMLGIRQLLEIPKSFINKATLAERAGTVTKITPAAHGGHYVHVDTQEHYVSPHLPVLVHTGQVVEAGDVLSDGVPKPDELMKHKGIGAARQYLVDAMHDLYQSSNAGMDKRHFEVLARTGLNHVRILEHSDDHPELTRGDTITYAKFKEHVGRDVEEVTLAKAKDRVLGKEVMHFTVGTPLTASITQTLKANGVAKVTVARSMPRVEFAMRPFTRNPLLNPDWMARLSHRYLKDSLMRGAHVGDVSDLHGVHPIPAYAYGAEFGTGPDGKY